MMGEKANKAALAIALAFVFLLAYAVHIAYPYFFIDPDNGSRTSPGIYPYPLHSDEWSHLSASLAIAEEGRVNFNPLTGKESSDRELGFHLLLAGLFMIPGLDPVFVYHLLASLMLVVNAFILYWIVSRLTKNEWIGLATIPFLVLVPSNANILGNWFFTPQTFSMALIFIYAYVFSEALESKEGPAKRFSLAGVIFLISIFVYPFAAVLMALLSADMLTTRIGFIRKNWKSALVFLGVMAAVSILFIRLYFGDGSSISSTIGHFFSEISFEPGWTTIEYSYSIVRLYGLVPLLLVPIGAAYLVFKKKGEPRLFFVWPALHFLILIIYQVAGTSLFLPYQRNLFYLLVSLAPLAGTGLYWVAKMVERRSQALFSRKNRKRQARVVAISIIAVILVLSLKDYYRIEPASFSLHKLITPEAKEALEWLGENEEPYQTLMASPFVSLVAYPVARMRVVGAMSASLEGGDVGAATIFFNAECEGKRIIVAGKNASLILSDQEIGCDFPYKIYSNKGIIIYKVKV